MSWQGLSALAMSTMRTQDERDSGPMKLYGAGIALAGLWSLLGAGYSNAE